MSDHVAARWREHGSPKRAILVRDEDSADAGRETQIDVGLRRVCLDRHHVRTEPLDFCAEVAQQLDHRLDVADPRHVAQRDGLGREQGRGEDRQRAVLVPAAHAPVQGPSALDHEGLGNFSATMWLIGGGLG